MKISLNLATRPYADIAPALKRLRIAMAVLVVIGLALGFGVHAFHQKAEEARATVQRVQNQIDAVNRERQGYQDLMRQPANALLLTQAAALNKLFDEKTFSWTLAMEDLETVLPAGVQVTTLEPARDAKTGQITLKLRVVGPRDRAVDLVQNLEHSRHFLLPRIVGESTESTSGPNQRLEPVSASNRVNFELLADYNSEEIPLSKTQKHQQVEKHPASGKSATQSATTTHPGHLIRPLQAPVTPATQPGRPPYTGLGINRPGPNRIPTQNPNNNPTQKQGGPR
jgi:type IV pilus assembly protein PilN